MTTSQHTKPLSKRTLREKFVNIELTRVNNAIKNIRLLLMVLIILTVLNLGD